jgi:hypothetical protein
LISFEAMALPVLNGRRSRTGMNANNKSSSTERKAKNGSGASSGRGVFVERAGNPQL